MENNKKNQTPGGEQGKKPSPIKHKDEIPKNPDQHIDQDFPGYPHAPSKEKHIKPETANDHKVASTKEVTAPDGKENPQPEMESDGSANAFSRTEDVPDDDRDRTKDSDLAY